MDRWPLRDWQSEALQAWADSNNRGIISAVTGAGKTVLALEAVARAGVDTTLIVVPTVPLLDQWWVEAAGYFGLTLDEVNLVRRSTSLKRGTINIAVINTAAKIKHDMPPCFLIVDECHRSASPQFRNCLQIPNSAALGLSATPERPYDSGLEETIIPALGPVLYRYTYREALRDGVIVPFRLQNIVFELEAETSLEYERLTRRIALAIRKHGLEASETIALLLKRTRVLNLSSSRVRLTLQLIARHRGQRVLVFHEDIQACDVIDHVLRESGLKSAVYHSRLKTRERAQSLAAFRRGDLEILVTCRALDEGFNVPEAQVGIIAASTATQRQRIQRLGRILRPSVNKEGAIVYTLVSTPPEIERLRNEEALLEGVAEISWSRA